MRRQENSLPRFPFIIQEAANLHDIKSQQPVQSDFRPPLIHLTHVSKLRLDLMVEAG